MSLITTKESRADKNPDWYLGEKEPEHEWQLDISDYVADLEKQGLATGEIVDRMVGAIVANATVVETREVGGEKVRYGYEPGEIIYALQHAGGDKYELNQELTVRETGLRTGIISLLHHRSDAAEYMQGIFDRTYTRIGDGREQQFSAHLSSPAMIDGYLESFLHHYTGGDVDAQDKQWKAHYMSSVVGMLNGEESQAGGVSLDALIDDIFEEKDDPFRDTMKKIVGDAAVEQMRAQRLQPMGVKAVEGAFSVWETINNLRKKPSI